MIIENENPLESSSETVTPNPEPVQDSNDIEKIDNIAQLREQYKSLKTDLDTYKQSHEFVSQTFGNTDLAKEAYEFYSGFTAEEFDADKFVNHINNLSPKRAEQLVEKLSSTKAKELVSKEVEALFGSNPTPEEIKLFKEWKETGYGLDAMDDIPDELKFNSDGTPKDEKELQFLRDLKNQVNEMKKSREQEELSKKTLQQQEYESRIEEQINSFANERLSILNKEFDSLGLGFNDKDTATDRQTKEVFRRFLVNGITGEFMSNPEALANYNSAITHIKNGEPVLARRYEAKIEAQLVNILRSDYVGKLLSSIIKVEDQPSPRPEISKSGTAKGDSGKPTGILSGSDLYKKLVSEGKISPA